MIKQGPLALFARQARLLALREVIDAGGGALLFYVGTELPASPETPTFDQLVATLPLAAPSGSIGVSGSLALYTLTTPRTVLCSSSGLIGWARLVNGAGDGVQDFLAGLPGSLMPLIVQELQVYTHGELLLVSCALAE